MQTNLDQNFEKIVYELLYSRVLPETLLKQIEMETDREIKETYLMLLVLRESLYDLGNGNLSHDIKGKGHVVNLLKKFQASLKHITYQASAVSEGSFSQTMDFMGDISDAFNKMVVKIKEAFEASEKHRKEAVENEKRHRLLADNATDVIWTMNLEGRFTYVSPSVEKLRGFTPEEVMEQSPEEVLCPGSLIHMANGLKKINQAVGLSQDVMHFRGELEQPCKDGSTVWTEATVSGIFDEEGRFIELLGISRDISDRKKLEAEIIKISVTDKLTQVYNRLKLESLLESAFNDAYTKGTSFHVVIFDIDYFKSVNDHYGHPTGDLVLVELAELMKKIIKPYPEISFGRWGGEEFMIIIRDMAFSKATTMIDEIRLAVELNEYSIPEGITCSFGIAQFRQPMNLTEVILAADKAMYQAKANGRNCVVADGDDVNSKDLKDMIRI